MRRAMEDVDMTMEKLDPASGALNPACRRSGSPEKLREEVVGGGVELGEGKEVVSATVAINGQVSPLTSLFQTQTWDGGTRPWESYGPLGVRTLG